MSGAWKIWVRTPRWLWQITIAVVASLIYLSGALDHIERELAEMRFEATSRAASGELVVVAIDPQSLRQLDTWPWPRGYHATVIERLLEAGASEIALDIDLSSHSSPDADAALRAALSAAAGRVILPVFRQGGDLSAGEPEIVHTAPVPEFRRLVRVASVNARPEADGLVWRHAVSQDWQDGAVPTMPAMLADRTLESRNLYYIDFGIRPDTLPSLSYVDVFSGQFDPAMLRGRKVIVGATAAELGDQFSVPVYKTLPGPIVQALAYETLVQDRALYRVAPWIAVVGIFAVALGFGRWFRNMSWRRELAAIAGLSILILAAAAALQAWAATIVDVSPVILAVVLLYGLALANRIDHQEMLLLVRGGRLRHNSALMRSIVESSSEAILTVTEDLIVEIANPAAEEIFETGPGGLVGRPLEEIFPAFDEKAGIERYLGVGGGREMEGRRLDGSTFPLEATVDVMDSDSMLHYVVVARDVTERKAQQKLLEYLALHDTLTGLPNRTLLLDRLEHAIATSHRDNRPLALLILDLDRFKEINDTLGHAVGDSLLAEVGQLISQPLRKTDTVARLGGDEFAILLPSVFSIAHAREVATRVADVLSRPFPVEGITVDVGVSIGLAYFPDHGANASELMRGADVAMYVAKRNHLSVAVYDEEKDTHSVRNLSMSGELRQAMESDELALAYQPQIAVGTGRLIGAEALLRWDHPRHGFVPPTEFVSLAEQTGQIRQLTRWVIGKALAQLAEWQARGLDIGLSVNLSPRNLHEEGLADWIASLLAEQGVRPNLLTLEITEDAIMTDPERALTAIRKLKDCGLRLAVDDFGTGYSSLAYLKAMPVDELKIDRSFVMHMSDDGNDEVIVRSTIDLAHNLGLSVVAEGVESELHLQALRRMSCDVGQGFHIGRPLDIDSFHQWVANHATMAADTAGNLRQHPGAKPGRGMAGKRK